MPHLLGLSVAVRVQGEGLQCGRNLRPTILTVVNIGKLLDLHRRRALVDDDVGHVGLRLLLLLLLLLLLSQHL